MTTSVALLAPGGVTNSVVIGISGTSYNVDASGVVTVNPPDVGPLLAAGFIALGAPGGASADVLAWNAGANAPQTAAAAGASHGTATKITSNLVLASATASTEGVIMKAVGTNAITQVIVPAGVGVKVYPPTGGKFASVTSTNEAILVAKNSAKVFIQTGATTYALAA